MEPSNRREDMLWTKYAKEYDPIRVGSIDATDTEPHDRAILKALRSEYTPDPKVEGDPHCTIFVARLNPRTTQETVEAEFTKFGEVARCRLVRDVVTGKSKRYAFVEYRRREHAQRAYDKMHHEYIDNAEILVDWEWERVMKGWKPRRLGGGFGGRKESGQLRFGCRERPFRRPIPVQPLRNRFQRND